MNRSCYVPRSMAHVTSSCSSLRNLSEFLVNMRIRPYFRISRDLMEIRGFVSSLTVLPNTAPSSRCGQTVFHRAETSFPRLSLACQFACANGTCCPLNEHDKSCNDCSNHEFRIWTLLRFYFLKLKPKPETV